MYKKIFMSAILAGLAISVGCIVFIKVGSIAGAVLFAFGLLTVVNYGLFLYTGKAGFIPTDFKVLVTTLLGNIVGCCLVSILAYYSMPDVIDGCYKIYEKRITLGLPQSVILSGFCGFIMTTAVRFAKEGKYLPLLFGVPLFILSGFLHSIADCMYLSASVFANTDILTNFDLYTYYISIVFGNYLGCNVHRVFLWN